MFVSNGEYRQTRGGFVLRARPGHWGVCVGPTLRVRRCSLHRRWWRTHTGAGCRSGSTSALVGNGVQVGAQVRNGLGVQGSEFGEHGRDREDRSAGTADLRDHVA